MSRHNSSNSQAHSKGDRKNSSRRRRLVAQEPAEVEEPLINPYPYYRHVVSPPTFFDAETAALLQRCLGTNTSASDQMANQEVPREEQLQNTHSPRLFANEEVTQREQQHTHLSRDRSITNEEIPQQEQTHRQQSRDRPNIEKTQTFFLVDIQSKYSWFLSLYVNIIFLLD